MTCRRFEQALEQEGTVSGALQAYPELKAHLEACPECRIRCAEEQELDDALFACSPDLPSELPPLNPTPRQWRSLSLSLAAVLIIGLIITVLPQFRPELSPFPAKHPEPTPQEAFSPQESPQAEASSPPGDSTGNHLLDDGGPARIQEKSSEGPSSPPQIDASSLMENQSAKKLHAKSEASPAPSEPPLPDSRTGFPRPSSTTTTKVEPALSPSSTPPTSSVPVEMDTLPEEEFREMMSRRTKERERLQSHRTPHTEEGTVQGQEHSTRISPALKTKENLIELSWLWLEDNPTLRLTSGTAVLPPATAWILLDPSGKSVDFHLTNPKAAMAKTTFDLKLKTPPLPGTYQLILDETMTFQVTWPSPSGTP